MEDGLDEAASCCMDIKSESIDECSFSSTSRANREKEEKKLQAAVKYLFRITTNEGITPDQLTNLIKAAYGDRISEDQLTRVLETLGMTQSGQIDAVALIKTILEADVSPNHIFRKNGESRINKEMCERALSAAGIKIPEEDLEQVLGETLNEYTRKFSQVNLVSSDFKPMGHFRLDGCNAAQVSPTSSFSSYSSSDNAYDADISEEVSLEAKSSDTLF